MCWPPHIRCPCCLCSQVGELQRLGRPGALVCEHIAGGKQQALAVVQAGRRHNPAGVKDVCGTADG